MKHYAKRDHMAQDAAGNYYSRHVSAMTAEALHAKSDIAGELAHRDIEIDRLRGLLRECVAADWRTNDNTLWTRLLTATREQGAND